jgi:hypothetical protein
MKCLRLRYSAWLRPFIELKRSLVSWVRLNQRHLMNELLTTVRPPHPPEQPNAQHTYPFDIKPVHETTAGAAQSKYQKAILPLIYLYPKHIREEFGAEMTLVYSENFCQAYQQSGGKFIYVLTMAAIELVIDALKERSTVIWLTLFGSREGKMWGISNYRMTTIILRPWDHAIALTWHRPNGQEAGSAEMPTLSSAMALVKADIDQKLGPLAGEDAARTRKGSLDCAGADCRSEAGAAPTTGTSGGKLAKRPLFVA